MNRNNNFLLANLWLVGLLLHEERGGSVFVIFTCIYAFVCIFESAVEVMDRRKK